MLYTNRVSRGLYSKTVACPAQLIENSGERSAISLFHS